MTTLLLAVSLIITPGGRFDVSPMLGTLSALETNNHWDRVGAAGELGGYQIKRSVWIRWSKEPFTLAAVDCMETQRVVICQWRWLMEGLERHGIRPTPENVATAWNAGLERFLERRTTHAERDFGKRFGRLYRQEVSLPQVASP